MLSVVAFVDHGVEHVDDPDRISDLVADPATIVWVDVVDETPDDLELLRAEFNLHPLAMEDALHHGQRPKLEQYPDHAFLVAYAADPDPADLPEIDVFLGPNWLVTVRERNSEGRCFDAEPLPRRYLANANSHPGVDLLLVTLLDLVVDGYFAVLDDLEDHLESFEDHIFSELDAGDGRTATSPDPPSSRDSLQAELLTHRRKLINVRRKIVPLREVVLALLRRQVAWIGDDALLHLQNVLDHQLRIIDEIDAQRELLDGAVDAHMELVANRTNEIMKKTSSWGAILVVATLITGIYGMNFRHMPELEQELGYPAALLSIVLVTGGLYLFFHRKRWL